MANVGNMYPQHAIAMPISLQTQRIIVIASGNRIAGKNKTIAKIHSLAWLFTQSNDFIRLQQH